MTDGSMTDGDHGPTETDGSIRVVCGSPHTVVHLRGEVDATLREEASVAMGQVLGASSPVVCDATDLRFIDSTGVAFLLQLRMATREAGLAMSLWDPRHVVGELLDAIGMADELPLAGVAPGGA